MIIPLSVSAEEAEKIKKHASEENLTVQIMIRSVVLEGIRNAEDRRRYQEALEDYYLNPQVFSFSKVKKECTGQ